MPWIPLLKKIGKWRSSVSTVNSACTPVLNRKGSHKRTINSESNREVTIYDSIAYGSNGGCSRRMFFGRCLACAAGASIARFNRVMPFIHADEAGAASSAAARARVKLIFAHPDPKQPNWPNIGYDFDLQILDFQAKITNSCPDIEFLLVTVTSGSAEEANRIINSEPDVDGYIVYLVGCLWGDMSETIAASGKPTIFVDNLFAGSGEFLTSYARAKREGRKIAAVSSSRFQDVVDAARCFSCLGRLQSSTALVVGSKPDENIKTVYGAMMKEVAFKEINDSYGRVKPSDAAKWADTWTRGAEKVIEPSRKDIEDAAGMYLAMLDLMKQNNAQAITVNCLGGIYSGNMVAAYPCLGFMQLDNDGLVGACESDQRSTMTKLLMSYLTGRPGFISDPVIDTSQNRIIYVHCVAPTKVFGSKGSSNPYHLRSHSEDRKGACNRSLMPLGEMTTTVLFDHNKKQVILHQGKTVENVDDDKACRNKLAVEVKGDVYKLLEYWDEWGWHRVTFYGDLKRPVVTIASLLGFDVIEEA